MGHSCGTLCGTLLWDTLVGLSSSSPNTPRTKVVLQGRQFSASSSPDTPRTTVVLQGRQFSASSSTDCSAYSSCTTKSPVLSFQLHRLLRLLKLYYKVASRQFSASSSTDLPSHQFSSCSSLDTPRTKVVLQSRQCSPAFRALDAHDLRRGLRGHRTNRTLACISRARHARSPQRVARAWDKSHSRLHFARSTRTIFAEGCARMGQIALSPAFGTLDTHDLRRGLRVKSPKRAFRSRLPHKLTCQSLQNERFVRDFLQKSSGNTHRSTHTSRSPAKQFRDSSPSKQHPLTRQSQCDSDIPLYHNSQTHDSLRLPRIFPRPRV